MKKAIYWLLGAALFTSITLYAVASSELEILTEGGHHYSSNMEPRYSHLYDMLYLSELGITISTFGLLVLGVHDLRLILFMEDY